MRRRIDLGGRWERLVNGEHWDFISVPSSLHITGVYVLKRSAWLPRLDGGQRAFLHFEAITYHAVVAVNGTKLGEMGPYIPYEFEMNGVLRDGENSIEVTIHDLAVGPNGEGRDDIAIGVNPGWEAYGGIIRDTWIEIRPTAFVENVRLGYTVAHDASSASCQAGIFLNAATDTTGDLAIALLHGATEIVRAEGQVSIHAGLTTAPLSFRVSNPLLWSTNEPHLYTVVTTLRVDATNDVHHTRTGFRQFTIRDRQFLWNGKPLVWRGVCRHDMWGDQGFTLTRDQMREDMSAIKMMGANFVRLVHYPHDRYIIELAEELGLLITEEPGYWQVDFPSMPPSEVEAGLRILEGAIRRDWNSPAVFGWFLGNESRLTIEYLRKGKALCDRLDPLQRPVSFANSTSKEKAKQQFEDAGLDFFSQHLYDFDRDKFETTANYYGPGKPLVIDEWGWEDVGHGEIFWDRNFDGLLEAVKEGKIAGHSFWSWNDMRQYARIDWPTHDGVLFSGVVTETREPRANLYHRLSELFQGQLENPEGDRLPNALPFSSKPIVVPLRIPVVTMQTKPIDLQAIADSASSRDSWNSLEQAMERFWATSEMAQDQWLRTGKRLLFWREPVIDIAGTRFVLPTRDGFVTPLVVTPEFPELRIPIGRNCDRLYVLGNVTFPSGYPVEGKNGAIAASFELRYQDGRKEQIGLRNGVEIARSNLIYNATRIEPLALSAPQALIFIKDPAREHYQLLLSGFPVRGAVSEVRCRLENGPPLAIFAISAGSSLSKEKQNL